MHGQQELCAKSQGKVCSGIGSAVIQLKNAATLLDELRLGRS
jgi:hypothetical protein